MFITNEQFYMQKPSAMRYIQLTLLMTERFPEARGPNMITEFPSSVLVNLSKRVLIFLESGFTRHTLQEIKRNTEGSDQNVKVQV